jgi:hypothetical protein
MTSLPPTPPSCPTRDTTRAQTRAHRVRQTRSGILLPPTPSTRDQQLQPRLAAEVVSLATRLRTHSERLSSRLRVDRAVGHLPPTHTHNSSLPTPLSPRTVTTMVSVPLPLSLLSHSAQGRCVSHPSHPPVSSNPSHPPTNPGCPNANQVSCLRTSSPSSSSSLA